MGYESREYNKPAEIEYEGTLTKNRNQRPTCDQAFLDWCMANAEKFTAYDGMGRKLGLKGSTFKRLMQDHGIELKFGTHSKMAPKPYQNYDWLFNQIVTLNKSIQQVAEENGWTVRVVTKWTGLLGINRRTFKDLKEISDKQRDLIKFSLLGDGCISEGGYFIVSHSEKQKDYLYWKFDMLKDLCSHEPTWYDGADREINGKVYYCRPYYRFNTRRLTELEEIRNIPVIQLIDELNEFGLSIWVLDDGSRGPYWELCVASYTDEEKEHILNKLHIMGLTSASLANCDNRYLRLNANDSRTLDSIILRNISNDLDIIKDKILENSKIRPERGSN